MYMCLRGIVFGSFYDFSIALKKKLVKHGHYILKCLHDAINMWTLVYTCLGHRIYNFQRFFHWILDYSDIVFSFFFLNAYSHYKHELAFFRDFQVLFQGIFSPYSTLLVLMESSLSFSASVTKLILAILCALAEVRSKIPSPSPSPRHSKFPHIQ